MRNQRQERALFHVHRLVMRGNDRPYPKPDPKRGLRASYRQQRRTGEFPEHTPGRRSLASRYLILGIGTQSNNSPSGPSLSANPSDGDLTTNYNGANYSAFLDTGSNGLFFPSSQIATVAPGQWCNPSSLLTLRVTNTGYTQHSPDR